MPEQGQIGQGTSAGPAGWDAILRDFRAAGGVLDNVALRVEDGVRGLFPVNPDLECRILVPRTLIVPSDDVRLHNGRLTVKPDSAVSPVARSFFETYHTVTSWADGGRDAIEHFFLDLQRLPAATKALLSAKFGLAQWFEPVTDDVVLLHFLRSRRIAIEGTQYLMPVMELLNHDFKGQKLDIDNFGLAFSGQFSGALAFRYRIGDAFQIFRSYQFASAERFTFSLPFSIFDKRLQRQIQVAVDTASRDPQHPDLPTPVIRKTGTADQLAFALLGDRADPRNGPRSFWKDVAPQLGVNKMEFFEGLLHYNRQMFLTLLETVENDTSPAAPLIRKVCRLQLEGLNMVSFQ